MLPIRRSVIAQVYHRGGRSIGNFSSSLGSIGERVVDKYVHLFVTTPCPGFVGIGFVVYGGQEVCRAKEVEKKMNQDFRQRLRKVPGVVRNCLAVAWGYFLGHIAFGGHARKLEEMHQKSMRDHEENERRSEELARKLNLSG